ncbi:MAG: twin-arginine translocase TatA/TatE family subunit [Pseudomonadales bacterium]|nr:twin-arginine translocase TatA/TatE family subunit [Pseudomonadales bacterium]
MKIANFGISTKPHKIIHKVSNKQKIQRLRVTKMHVCAHTRSGRAHKNNTILNTLAFIGGIGAMEITVLAILGVLIFGKRLPDVGKNIGRGIIEFKKGLSGITDELDIKQIKEDVSISSNFEQSRKSGSIVSKPAVYSERKSNANDVENQ